MKYNNAKPVAFARGWIYLLLLVLTACADTPSSSTTGESSSSPSVIVVNSRDLLNFHNQARVDGTRCSGARRAVAPALIWNDQLAIPAKSHALYMARTKKLSHTGNNGSSFTNRIEQTGYRWSIASENIAYGHKSIESAMQAWLKSKAHCANIINSEVSEMGAAVADDYWVTVFAKPRN